MKVEKSNVKPFEPITITIETQEEAQLMWASLNMPLFDVRKNNTSVNLNFVNDNNIHYDMFTKFNQIYNAKG